MLLENLRSNNNQIKILTLLLLNRPLRDRVVVSYKTNLASRFIFIENRRFKLLLNVNVFNA